VLGKPVGQDAALGRPSAAHQLGLDGAIRHFDGLVAGAIAAVPECPGAPLLRAMVRAESERLVPRAWCAGRGPPGCRLTLQPARRDAVSGSSPLDHAAMARGLPLAPGLLSLARPLARPAQSPVQQPALPPLGSAPSRSPAPWPAGESRALFDLVAGFVYSQVLLACVRLRLFEHLADGPERRPRWPARLGLPRGRRPSACWHAAVVAAACVERAGDGRCGLGPLGAPLVGQPGAGRHGRAPRRALRRPADPVALLRGERPGPGAVALLGLCRRDRRAPGALPRATGRRVLGAHVGVAAAGRRGGAGRLPVCAPPAACSTWAVARAPSSPRRRGARLRLRLMLFDLPAVVPTAPRARFAERGPGPTRARCHGGNFSCDPLPTGADLVTLVRVLLRPRRRARADDPACRPRRACRPAARCWWPSRWPARRARHAMGDAYFGFYLLAMGQRPRAHRAGRSPPSLREVGFADVRELPTAAAAAGRRAGRTQAGRA
jgi:demethylspheroidene O-methyltransferase